MGPASAQPSALDLGDFSGKHLARPQKPGDAHDLAISHAEG
jgi:hypothetical protein